MALESYAKVEGITTEILQEDDFEAIESSTRVVRMTLNDGVTLESLPRHVCHSFNAIALMVVAGRAPM